MKKIEAIIQPGSRDAVIAAIKKIGVGGVTVHQVQGQGAQDPPLVGLSRRHQRHRSPDRGSLR